MTVLITVGLPDDIVAFVDAQVASGAAPSRAAVVARALEHERRREATKRGTRIDTSVGGAGEFDELATWAARQPMDIA